MPKIVKKVVPIEEPKAEPKIEEPIVVEAPKLVNEAPQPIVQTLGPRKIVILSISKKEINGKLINLVTLGDGTTTLLSDSDLEKQLNK